MSKNQPIIIFSAVIILVCLFGCSGVLSDGKYPDRVGDINIEKAFVESGF